MESPKKEDKPRKLLPANSCSGEWWEIELVILKLLKNLEDNISTILHFRSVCKSWQHFAIPLIQKLHRPIKLLGAEDGNLIQFLELLQASTAIPFSRFHVKILLNRERCDDDWLELLASFGGHMKELKIRLEFGAGITELITEDEGLFEHREKHLGRTKNLKKLEIGIVNRIPLKELLRESSMATCVAIEAGIKRFLALMMKPALGLEYFKFTAFDLDLDQERETLEDCDDVEEEHIHKFYWGDAIANSMPPKVLDMCLCRKDFKDKDWVRLPKRRSGESSAVVDNSK